jgi:putative tricarboxylic transport membrane protein
MPSPRAWAALRSAKRAWRKPSAPTALMEKMTATPQSAEACKMHDWTQITLLGDDYKAFLAVETARIEGILKELGLA